ncbi:MAG: translocation/assembly module TamB domain-containing protein [Prevotella sp.]|nr:translocation/assembly module TamB domain-containing protein [Prevotella sp.]
MRRILKYIAYTVLVPIAICLLLAILVYLPPIQRWAVKTVASYMSQETGMQIGVGYVRIAFPLDLELRDFIMTRQNLANTDTIADVSKLTLGVAFRPLLNGRIDIDAFELDKGKVNTADFIPSVIIDGNVGRLYVESHGIELSKENVNIEKVIVENSSIGVTLCDSVPEDTTKSDANWKIKVSDLALKSTHFQLHMPGDSMSIATQMDETRIKGLDLKLGDGVYGFSSIDWKGGQLAYNIPYLPATKGFDANHIQLSNLYLGIDDFIYSKDGLSLRLRGLHAKEQCGLDIRRASGNFKMDSRSLVLDNFSILTPYSDIKLNRMNMDFNAFADKNPVIRLSIDAKAGMEDILYFVPSIPHEIVQSLPSNTIFVKGTMSGNMKRMLLSNTSLRMQDVIAINVDGYIANIDNPSSMALSLNMKGTTGNLSFVKRMLPKDLSNTLSIPNGIGLDGNVRISGGSVHTDMLLTQGGGKARINGAVDTGNMTFGVTLKTIGFPLHHFLPNMGLGPLTADISATGKGFDIMSPSTGINVKANIKEFNYAGYNLNGLSLAGNLNNGKISLNVGSVNPIAAGKFSVEGSIASNRIDVMLRGKINGSDLRALKLTDKRYEIEGVIDAHVVSDMADNHSVNGYFENIHLFDVSTKTPHDVFCGSFQLDASMRKGVADISFDGRIDNADLFALGMVANPLSIGLCADIRINSDFRNQYAINGVVDELTIKDNDGTYETEGLAIDILSDMSSTHAMVESGDFSVLVDAKGGFRHLSDKIGKLTSGIEKQISDKHLNYITLCEMLPTSDVTIRSTGNNLFSRTLGYLGLGIGDVDFNFNTSPENGINGNGHVTSLEMKDNGLTLDSIHVAIESETEALNYDIGLLNNGDNTYPFKVMLDGKLDNKGLLANMEIYDKNGGKGLAMSMLANIEQNGARLSVVSPTNIIGYKEFRVNDGNYVYLGNDNRISADLVMKADDGTGVQVYSEYSDPNALQDLTLSVNRLNLEKIFDVLPYTPQISGILNGDFHVKQTTEELSISSDMKVEKLVYEQCSMGDVGSMFVYIPQEDGTHYLDGIILQNDVPVGTVIGSYDSTGDGLLDAEFNLDKFPMGFINGFIPDQIIGLRGVGEGSVTMKGPINALDINGEVYLDSCYLFSNPYGVEMRFANDPVRIVNSKVLFENFEMFANNDSPLNIQGSLDFSNMDKMRLDVRMKATDFEVIDAKRNPRSEIYGKAFINFLGAINGPLDDLTMKGKVDILGNTDMTYIMKESVLTTDNELDQLVKFTDFSDSIPDNVAVRPDLTGFNMALGISIDEQAHIMCALNASQSNYIDLIGGGDLRMLYDPANELRLIGRYTLSDGEMKYSLPVIPLRTFNIKEGSYIEFTGEPFNPTLSITATERLKSNVSDGSAQGRIVDFECGVSLTQTLSSPSIEFIIDAPEDMQMSNELNTKSTEERGKLAVSMLASGMYLGEGSSANSAMSGALASFMQSEINNITGSALRSMGLDLSANMETSTDATGSLHTDYTFKFSKRLWNNRLRIIMGGRVSTGSDAGGDNGAFFDNFSMEYRLNKNETQYLKLFYEREAYDWLEGNVSEFGAGFLWRRKLSSLKELFKSGQTKFPDFRTAVSDSTKREEVKK